MLEGAQELGDLKPSNAAWGTYAFSSPTTYLDDTYGNRACMFIDDNHAEYVEGKCSFGAQSNFWLRHRAYRQSSPTNGYDLVIFYDSAMNPLFKVRAFNNVTDILSYNGSSWDVLATASTRVFNSGLGFFDVNINIAVNGHFKVYKDDTITELDYEGDLSAFANIEYFRIYSAGSSNKSFSEVIWGDESTLAHRYISQPANAEGNYTAGSGDHTAVDETTIDTNDSVTFANANDRQSFTHAAFGSLPAGIVKSVCVNAYVANAAGGPQNIKGFLRKGGNDYDQATAYADIGLGFDVYRSVWHTDPATASPWVTNDAISVSVEFGHKAEA